MCIDLVAGGKSKNTKRTSPRSEDTYLKLTVKLYDFIRQMTKCHFSKVIRHRLCMSKVNKAPLLLSRLIRYMQGKEDKIVVLVGTVIVGSTRGPDLRLERSQGYEGRVAKFVFKNHT